MKLSQLLKVIDGYEIRGSDELEITDVCYHSKKVTPGSLFVAIPGFKTDGREYIQEAITRGAVAVVLEDSFFDNLNVTQIRVWGARLALARLSANFFVHPTKSFYLAGITGTNGKTTLTYLLETLWQVAGRSPGVIGTINTRYKNTVNPSDQTTPESRDLQEVFLKMKDQKTDMVCMEVSSHAIDLNRVDGLQFDVCIFTNLSQEHLDYHKTMEAYYQSKEKLFITHLPKSGKKNKCALIHGEGFYEKRLLAALNTTEVPVYTYGFEKTCDIHPKTYHLSSKGISAEIMYKNYLLKIESSLMGSFNLLNIMAAVGIGFHSGLTEHEIKKGIEHVHFVPGRLERIQDPKGRHIFVDYAHTPDALKNVLETLKEIATKKMIVVFGCGGDRDKSKREPMGFEVAQVSDVCIVTSDNPRTEDPKKIIQDILPGVKKGGVADYQGKKGFLIEVDRRKAIHKALELSGKEDIVLIAGKGHEDYQILGTTKHPFSDQEVVREFLR